jgi:hypothetical protein
MLVFRNGTWMTVDMSFLAADPGLSEGQRRIGAAVAANHLARGRSKAAAVAAAEKAVYAAAYSGLLYESSPPCQPERCIQQALK